MSAAHPILTEDHRRFLRTGLLGLAFQEARSAPRLFGPEADHRWTTLKGLLRESDRITLALRDGARVYGAAFGPREAFGLPELATDEPFGPDWPLLDEDAALALWNEARAPEDPREVLTAALEIWGRPAPPEPEVPAIGPADTLLAVGLGAALALLPAFLANEDLDWHRQVLVVAEAPADRQIAGLLAVVLGTRKPTRLAALGDLPGEAAPGRIDVRIEAPEATEAERTALEAPAGR